MRRMWSRVPPHSGFYARTTQYRSEPLAMARRGLVAVIPAALLALLGVLLTADLHVDSKHLGKGFPGSYASAIAQTMQKPAVASALAILLLVALTWLIRRALLAWLVWRPGRIVVPPLEGAGAASKAQVSELSAIFRERLALLRLESADTAPGATPEGAFLDVLEGASSSDPVGSIVRLLRGAVPRHALVVQGVLRKRASSPEFGVTVQVAQQPGQASPSVEFWEHSWREAARKAADGVTATILPRTRLCIGPWAGWRGYQMPPMLLIAYERGAQHEQEREFDQARERYWEALRLDPTNLTIRLQLGQLQEKAGNPIAALTSYLRILAFANPGGELLPRGLHRRSARRECERVLILAKYRAIVLFGAGTTVDQWCRVRSSEETIPNWQDMHEEFQALLKPLAEARRRDPVADSIARATKLLLENPTVCSSADLLRLECSLLHHAYRAGRELKLSLSRLETRPWRRPVTRRTIDLTLLCLERRLEARPPDDVQLRASSRRRVSRQVRWAGWRPGPWALWWPSRARRWQWHEHYNAACVYALMLDGKCADPTTMPDIAQHAIRRLERAISTRDSGFVSNWRDWVVHEDPDLTPLRRRPEFIAFEEMYFPADGPPRKLDRKTSRSPQRLIESIYTRDALRASALFRLEAWRARAHGTLDRPAMPGWCAEDQKQWEQIRAIVKCPYDWRFRQVLVEHVHSLPSEMPPPAISFITHEQLEKRLEKMPQSDRKIDETLLDFLDGRLRKLHDELVQDERSGGPDGLHCWLKALDHVNSVSPLISPSRGTGLCEQHARVWLRLADWLVVEDRLVTPIAKAQAWEEELWQKHDEACAALVAEIERAAKMWRPTVSR